MWAFSDYRASYAKLKPTSWLFWPVAIPMRKINQFFSLHKPSVLSHLFETFVKKTKLVGFEKYELEFRVISLFWHFGSISNHRQGTKTTIFVNWSSSNGKLLVETKAERIKRVVLAKIEFDYRSTYFKVPSDFRHIWLVTMLTKGTNSNSVHANTF